MVKKGVSEGILTHNDLKFLLIDSLKSYSEDVVYISGNNPYLFNINRKPTYICIKNIHSSGIGRTNPDECRIQIGRTKEFLSAKNSGLHVFFFGYYLKYNVFTAWNPFQLTKRINEKSVVSVYSRFSTQKKASDDGISVYEDEKHQKIISFKPEYLGLYLENFKIIHQSDEVVLKGLIKKSDDADSTESNRGITVEVDRKKFTITHKRFKRDGLFKKIIYDSYSHRCAICGIQLELIEAAHIIPHSHDQGNDDPRNGVCLCSLHHKAYDSGLIYFDENYNLKLNQEKVDYLEKTKKDGGIQKFIKMQYEKLLLPESYLHRPSSEYIKIANKIRGIKSD